MWFHAVGCRRYFNVTRDTLSYEILETYLTGTQPTITGAYIMSTAVTQNRFAQAPGVARMRQHRSTLRFNGKAYTGRCYGDTLASALLANGVDVVGRSFKYARPQGHISVMGPKSPTALFSWAQALATVPNLQADPG